MNKIILIFLTLLLIEKPFFTSEPLLARLSQIYSNDMQKFGIANYSFTCKSYGVVSLDELMRHSNINATCKRSIEMFQKENPLLDHLAQRLLHVEQFYHIDLREGECIVYAKGEMTLAEILLENGLAQVSQKFRDRDLVYRYKEAQKRAKFDKVGMFGNRVSIDCLAEFLRAE